MRDPDRVVDNRWLTTDSATEATEKSQVYRMECGLPGSEQATQWRASSFASPESIGMRNQHTADWAAWQQPLAGMRLLCRAPAPRRIQLYGQRCSGTNFAATTLQANFGAEILTEDYGFKHWFVPRQMLVAPDTLVLVVARDAFDWVRSLYGMPWHAHPDLKAMDFSAFLRAEWISLWDEDCYGLAHDHPMFRTEMMQDRCPETGARFANCVAKRTAKLRHWSGLTSRAHNVALLSYETLTTMTAAVIDALALVLAIRPARFVANPTYKGQGERTFVATPYPPMAPADAAQIAKWLDPEVEAQFGLSPHHG